MSGFEKIIAIVGLPRSGTTLSAAIFDAHPNIITCFEPWNSDKNERVANSISIPELMRKYNLKKSWSTKYIAIKETSITDAAIDWLDEFLQHQSTATQVQIVWTIRNYSHTYLSLIDGARKYWGHETLEVNVQSYNQWVNRAQVSTQKLASLYQKYTGVAYSYDAMVQHPEQLLPQLMQALGINYDQRQLNYFKHVQKEGIRGDVGLSTEPAPISNESGVRRNREWEQVYQTLQQADADPVRVKLDQFADKIFQQKIFNENIRVLLPA